MCDPGSLVSGNVHIGLFEHLLGHGLTPFARVCPSVVLTATLLVNKS